jgi:AraC-like DNA-binding protein
MHSSRRNSFELPRRRSSGPRSLPSCAESACALSNETFNSRHRKDFFRFLIDRVCLERIYVMRPRSARIALSAVRNWPELAAQANYRVDALAELTHVSPRTLRRFVQERIHVPTQQWMNHLRSYVAAKLRRAGQRVKEIADAVGYKQSANVSRRLQRHHSRAKRLKSSLPPLTASLIRRFRRAGFWPK